MCGIVGALYSSRDLSRETLEAHVAAMAGALDHRGPDARGAWTDETAGIAFGHTRLSIVDLSAAGAQPMASACGRYVISYNGEIYNAAELREEIPGIAWRGHSDTEVVLEACAALGVESALKKFVGMFAFALWDRQTRTLYLARDQLGIKPLYWGRQGGVFLFASELKAMAAHPAFVGELDRDALGAFMRLNYVPAPASIYRGIRKLEPGQYLTLADSGEETSAPYWNLREVARCGQAAPADMDDGEALDRADALLRDAVHRCMVSDVPLGALLSGGIDSSTVAALMQATSAAPVRTFSIGFSNPRYNEAPYAAAIARHLGTDHRELYVDPDQALDVIPGLPDKYDEPFADSSQIPTYLVSSLARDHVTVALSGDGGDEVFAGYTRYFWGDLLARRTMPWPRALRQGASRLLSSLSEDCWERLFSVLPASMLPTRPGQKIHKLANVLAQADDMALFRRLVTVWENPAAIVPGAREIATPIWDDGLRADVPAFMERMQLLDSLTYLPDDILTKVDRASMAVSLEVRVPLLDHRVVEFAWSLPRRMRVRDGQGKWLLRKVLERYVPTALIDRPKMGFGIPLGSWLRGPLRDWAESLLSAEALGRSGLLAPKPVRAAWDLHLSGNRDLATELWTVLMFQAWHEKWKPSV